MGVRGFGRLVAGGLLAAASGCAAGADPGAEQQPCMFDSDCSPTEKCQLLDSPGMHTARAAPIQCPAMQTCATSDDCSAGFACIPYAQAGFESWQNCPPTVCGAPCTASTCKSDEVCRSSGACELARCDESGAPACAEHWRCDPEAAATESTDAISGAVETDDPVRAVARGCVRVRCDEEEGFACREDWECEKTRSLEGTGCAAIPCEELGHCSSDAYICAPTGSGPRPHETGVVIGGPSGDPFGCVLRNCEEGRACPFDWGGRDLGYCNPSAPHADQYGCSIHNCLEVSNLCPADSRCAPTDPNASVVGCARDCEEGAKCSTYWSVCVPL